MALKSRETVGKAFPGLGSQHEIKQSLTIAHTVAVASSPGACTALLHCGFHRFGTEGLWVGMWGLKVSLKLMARCHHGAF